MSGKLLQIKCTELTEERLIYITLCFVAYMCRRLDEQKNPPTERVTGSAEEIRIIFLRNNYSLQLKRCGTMCYVRLLCCKLLAYFALS